MLKRWKFVKVEVINAFENILDGLFDIPEIDAYANFIQSLAPNKNFYDPIVPMYTRTIAWVTPEGMGGREMGFYINFKDPSHCVLQFHPATAARCLLSQQVKVTQQGATDGLPTVEFARDHTTFEALAP